MKSLVTSFFGVPSTAMNPLQRESHFSKPENNRRIEKFKRRTDERCICQHGHFWHMNGGRCNATTYREHASEGLGGIVAGQPCKCICFELQPDRRVP